MPMGEKTKLLWADPKYRERMVEIHKNSFKKGRSVWNKGNHVYLGGKRFEKGNTPWNKGTKGIVKAWNKGKKNCFSQKTIIKMSDARKGIFCGDKHPRWKGGKTKKDGYVFIYSPDHPFKDHHGYVREHRLVVESQIGRFLEPKENVHHINKITDDNVPKNLMAFSSKSAHNRFHGNPDKVKPEEIVFDGRLHR